MIAHALVKFACAAIAAAAVPLALPAQQAFAAQPASAPNCPDIEVDFARGTAQAPGLGPTGFSFVQALRFRAGGKSVGAYGINYPASADFAHPPHVLRTALEGISDAQSRVEYMAANCPGTKIVLGGYSQGAAVAGLATMAGMPPGVRAEYAASVPPPMPPQVADHVAAVVLFGTPSDRFMRDIGAPPIAIGPLYAGKTKSYCIPLDTICNGAPAAQPNALHVLYSVNGMTFDAAGFALSHLK